MGYLEGHKHTHIFSVIKYGRETLEYIKQARFILSVKLCKQGGVVDVMTLILIC